MIAYCVLNMLMHVCGLAWEWLITHDHAPLPPSCNCSGTHGYMIVCGNHDKCPLYILNNGLVLSRLCLYKLFKGYVSGRRLG